MSKAVLKPQQSLRSNIRNTAIVFVSSLFLGGCAAANLNKLAVSSIAVAQAKAPGIAPGEKSSLVVSMTEANGKPLATNAEGEEKIRWSDLSVTGTVVKADKKGNVSLPSDPRKSFGKQPHVSVTVPSHPDLHADLDIPLRYDRAYTAHYSGSSGTPGLSGTNGMDGMAGSNGSTDPNSPSPGGNGSDGTNGTDGSDGSNGDDGPAVTVRVAFVGGVHPLLQVSVGAAKGKQKYFLVDPDGGSLTVTSEGGSGGSGGSGGRGGSGGAGGSGWPPGMSGSNGSNGQDGRSGQAGNGGRITVLYDPQARSFLSAIRALSPNGPSPIFREQTIASAW
jgi:hypothetical protein